MPEVSFFESLVHEKTDYGGYQLNEVSFFFLLLLIMQQCHTAAYHLVFCTLDFKFQFNRLCALLFIASICSEFPVCSMPLCELCCRYPTYTFNSVIVSLQVFN